MDNPRDFVPLHSVINFQSSRDPSVAGPDLHGDIPNREFDFDPLTRRRFLDLLGASMALAAGAGCTRPPTEFILPYVDPPERVIPGLPKYYATAALAHGVAQGVIVECHLGRPTKVEGNPAHPASLGATDVLSQASILDLYDPGRSQQIQKEGRVCSWEEFAEALEQVLAPIRSTKGQGLRILTETVVSPTLGGQIRRVLTDFPNARWHQYDPAGPHSARKAAWKLFGRYLNTYYRLEQADVILAIDSDFLTCGSASTRYARDFVTRRRAYGPSTPMNRLYVVESTVTATGGKADHRFALRYPEIAVFASDLLAAIQAGGNVPRANGPHAAWLAAVAHDLLAHGSRSAVLAGDSQSEEVHSLCHLINHALGNIGQTVIYTEPIEVQPEDQIDSLRQLAADVHAGAVSLLLILGGNPVYNAPIDLDFAVALKKVATSIHVSLYHDETSSQTTWQIPETHYFETWGDARAFDGTITILQPLIEPLYDSRSHLEVLDLFLQFPVRTNYEIVRSHWVSHSKAPDFDAWWRKSVRQGFVAESALPQIAPAIQFAESPPVPQPPAEPSLDLVFCADPYLYDGRYANNAWLQELPRQITKLTWDNAVHLSPRTAQRLRLENQQVVEIRFRNSSIKGPVWITPGNAEETIAITLGYGRTAAGKVGNGVGFDAYRIRFSGALWYASGVEVRSTNETQALATTQMQQFTERRDILISEPVAAYQHDPDFVRKANRSPHSDETLYPPWTYSGYSWGMCIDLTACVNCSACIVACQAENNIPVVGKDQVLLRRAMHWLRVDVYMEGDATAPAIRYQPVPCMHCENAPCELVCPVQATVHSSDGLNDMVYNRCVGTRYCSNNCPYKVRRFNFFLFSDWYTEQLKMQRNPDVTVRSRGVMEKCTYCVQRIREAEIHAQLEDRPIRDGELQTACQQVCPTQAIVFGDLNNPSTRVARLRRHNLNYSLLAELNTRPHTTYLAELRNPNPALKESS
jgi:Fe-S-cluster-containing dehydrogenase component/anaerobic selenocysteine-containing dehydrogenase